MSGRLIQNLKNIAVSGHLGTSLIAGIIPCVPLVMEGVRADVVALSVLSIFFGSMAGFIANDLHDVLRDAINKPYRPLARGDLGVFFARATATVLLAASFSSIVLLLFVTPWSLLLAVYVVSYLVYNWINDHCILAKNIFIALGFIAPIGYSAILLGVLRDNVLFLIAGYLMFVGRELLMDVNDAKGDLLSGYRTLPNRIGEKKARLLVGFIWSISILLFALQCSVPSPDVGRLSICLASATLLLFQYSLWLKGNLSAASLRVLVISTWIPMCMFVFLLEV